jgi:hypothetical protein
VDIPSLLEAFAPGDGGNTIKRDASEANAAKTCSEKKVVYSRQSGQRTGWVERRAQNANDVANMSTGGTSADLTFIPIQK